MSEFDIIKERVKQCPDSIKELVIKIHTLSLLDSKESKINFYKSQVEAELLREESEDVREVLLECKTILEGLEDDE